MEFLLKAALYAAFVLLLLGIDLAVEFLADAGVPGFLAGGLVVGGVILVCKLLFGSPSNR